VNDLNVSICFQEVLQIRWGYVLSDVVLDLYCSFF
jgi:hypothetical protein